MSNSVDNANPIQESIFYLKNGIKSNRLEPSKEDNVLAKVITNVETKKKTFYAKKHGKDFYDPMSGAFRYDKRPWRLQIITESQFDNYLTYLGFNGIEHMNRKNYLIVAERG